jgi:predicted RNase H-like nuclease
MAARKAAHSKVRLAVLGLDCAWGPRNPSGVALAVEEGGRWRIAAASPSYDAFLGHTPGEDLASELLVRCSILAPKCEVAVVSADIPLAKTPITGRRTSDQAISKRFASAWCAVHSPSATRPGPVGEAMQQSFQAAGFALATVDDRPRRALLECYPHAGLLRLMNLQRRHPYKVARAASYWPDAPPAERREKLLQSLHQVRDALETDLGSLPVGEPDERKLKAYEDTLDAVVCAWVGILWLRQECEPFGDASSAIWVPSPRLNALNSGRP